MCKILVFAGTTEGYEITEFLRDSQVSVHMCVATDYGSMRLQENEYLTVSHERMNQQEMETFMGQQQFDQVIDATHPYAVEVTKNIKQACENCEIPYIRVLRGSGQTPEEENVVLVDSVEEAIDFLENTEGNILVTTGSKELHRFTRLTDYENRIYARVLSLPNVVEQCSSLGFQGAHLICMQGPFLKEMNTAMLRQYQCRYLVTKEAGKNGGFEEKCEAAKEAGAILVVIGRPQQEPGITVEECRQQLCRLCHIQMKPEVTLVGIGMGSTDTMTREAMRACRETQCIIGGKRLVDAVAMPGQAVCYEYNADKIKAYIDSHPQYHRFVVALSGDVGFYSGAKKLLAVLGEETKVICGISSVVYFMAKIGLSWEDAAIVSAHGKSCNLIHYIKSREKTFAILGTKDGVAILAQKLVHYGMNQVTMYVGEELSYPQERIRRGSPADFVEEVVNPLSVVCVVNPEAKEQPKHLSDAEFIRGKAPMTKEEVRSLSVDKLQLPSDAICYDIGAGTGSVTMEMAMQAYDGRVYAIERKPEAAELIRQNQKALALDNLQILEGIAPEALEGLEAPTHAFIGGSSGNLKEIVKVLLEKNPYVKMVINCITLETVTEALDCIKTMPLGEVDVVQVSVAKSKELGRYHMMMGENPIYIISCKGVAQ